jgi:uncharacterized protein (TIGR03083 family)
MDVAECCTRIVDHTERIAAAGEHADAPVPSCPGWTVADLIAHLGEVQRWAATLIEGGLTSLGDVPADFLGDVPPAAERPEWLRSGCGRLVSALLAADLATAYPVFLADPVTPPVQFWARRQAHESAIHAVDATSAVSAAAGAATIQFQPQFAADGIDEFLTGFVPRRRTHLHHDPPATIEVVTTDTPGSWSLTIGPDAPVAQRLDSAPAQVDCTVSGPAEAVYAALWNRGPWLGGDRVQVTGDVGLFALLGESVQIRWG